MPISTPPRSGSENGALEMWIISAVPRGESANSAGSAKVPSPSSVWRGSEMLSPVARVVYRSAGRHVDWLRER